MSLRSDGRVLFLDEVARKRAMTSAVHIVRRPMPAFDYRYELRRGEQVVATGHLTREQPFEVGDRVVIAGSAGTVRAVEPVLGERELRLVVQAWREGVDS